MGLRSAKSLPPDFSIRAGGQHQPRPPQTTSRAKWSVLAAAAVVTMIVTARRHSMSKPCGAVPLLPPGAPPPPFEEQMRQLPVFVLATDQMEDIRNVVRLTSILKGLGFGHVMWWNATSSRDELYSNDNVGFKVGRYILPWEYSVRDSFRNLLMHVWESPMKWPQFLILEADVTPHCNMTAMLKSVVMDSSICRPWGSLIGRPMGRAGPILLGAAETDIPKLAHRRSDGKCTCITVEQSTFGGFAVLYHRALIPSMLRWIESSHLPYEYMFLRMHGHNGNDVRVVLPNLFSPSKIQLPGKTTTDSDPSSMAQIGWKREDYCGWPKSLDRNAEIDSGSSDATIIQAQDERMLRIQMLASTLRQFDHEDLVATLPTIILARDHNGYKAKKLRDNLQAHGFRNVATWEILDGSKFWGGRADPGWDQTRDLEPEQIAMRQTLRDALRAARASGVQRVLILEDHAVPHCNLKVALERLLLDRRCGMLPLGDPKNKKVPHAVHGRLGMVLLGATEFQPWLHNPDLLPIVSDDKSSLCYKATDATVGAFATIFSGAKIPHVLRWLEETDEVLEQSWTAFSSHNMLVEVAHPNLFIGGPGSGYLPSYAVNISDYCENGLFPRLSDLIR